MSVMEKLGLVVKFIIVVSTAAATAAAAFAAADGDESKRGSLDANGLSNSKTFFLPVSENKTAFIQREAMAERNQSTPAPCPTTTPTTCPAATPCPTSTPTTCPAVTCPAVTSYPSTKGGCAGVIVGHQCLSFSSDELNWNEAQQACVSRGGHLAIPVNSNELLDYVIQQYGRGALRLWIGGSDITNEGTWLWLDGRPMSNFSWGSGQPNNWQGNQDCLEVNFEGGYNDVACTYNKQYICELGGCAGVIVGHQCLSLSSEKLNWNEAQQACVSRGGHLAIPTNPNELLDYVIQQYGRGAVTFWIGGSDITNEGSWLWLDGRPMSNLSWGSGQPDNWQGNENCLEVNWQGVYNDGFCYNNLRYICELGGCAGVIVGHQCLSLSTEELNWNEAQQACVSQGGHLAIPTHPNELLDYVIQQYGRGAVQLWIGGSDIANEGTWLWLDGRPMSSFSWGTDQPDNGGGNENCLEVNYESGYNDEPCTVKSRYICEL